MALLPWRRQKDRRIRMIKAREMEQCRLHSTVLLAHRSVLYWIPALLIALPIAPLCLSLLLCLSVRLLRLLIELLIAWSRYEKTVELERATRALQRAREVLAQV